MTATRVEHGRTTKSHTAGNARSILVCAGLLTLCLVGIVLTLGTGPLAVAAADIVPTLWGDRPNYEYAVIDTGLPRALLALLLGIALGTAGALTQALTRNPLGSPDIIGFDAGAATGAVTALLVFQLGGTQVALSAMVSGLVVAVAVFALAGGASGAGYRLILVGIAAAALLQGLTSYLLTRSDPRSALEGSRWIVGSLNLAGDVDSMWSLVKLVSVALIVLLPLAVVLARPLRMLLMGDEIAIAVGVRVGLAQTSTVVVAVLLAATAVSIAGPITFVALVAPALATPLVRRSAPTVIASGLVGGALLIYSDFLAQRVLSSVQPPVGVVTGILGGAYLAWMLARGRNLT